MAASSQNSSSKFYQVFIASRQEEPQLRNREVIFNIVLLGTGIAMAAFTILLLISYSIVGHSYVLGRLIACAVTFVYLAGVFWISRARYYRTAAYMLLLFYGFLASNIVWQWGLATSIGVLMFGLVIVLGSTLLNSGHALYAGIISCAAVLLIKLGLSTQTFYSTDEHYKDASLGDVSGYCVVFIILALVSWLFGRKVEHSLTRATQAEAALLQEKAMLKTRVQERTLQLRKMQVEEMQQMYNFAEIGQLSTSLLHDLANYLTVLNLEIESLHGKRHSDAIERTQHIIGHLDNMVDSVRDRLHGNVQESNFNIAVQTNEVMQFMHYKAGKADVQLDWQFPADTSEYRYMGDPIRYSQVVTILVTNAIDAYKNVAGSQAERRVQVILSETQHQIRLRIRDWGSGISRPQRKVLFKPLQGSTKKGMGIGLYIAKQMVELHFKGTLTLEPTMDHTEFVVAFPKKVL